MAAWRKSTTAQSTGMTLRTELLFEPFQIKVQETELIRPEDRDLQRALELHSLTFKK